MIAKLLVEYLVIVIVLSVYAGGAFGAKYPKDLPKCKSTDEPCMIKAAETIVKIASNSNGLPALGIPQIDPLHIDSMVIKQGAESPVNVELIFKNTKLYGFKDAVFSSIKGFDNATGKHEIKFLTKQISILGDYTISGRVLILPIQGEGKCNLTLDNLDVTIKFIPEKVDRNGKEYLKTQKYKLTFKTSRLYVHLGNLYRGDKALGDSTNLFLNQNWEDILNELKPKFFETFGEIFETIINSAFMVLPQSEFYIQ